MAFVRWRGLCAQLLTTEYTQGRSRQVLILNLRSGYTVPAWMRTQVKEKFPSVPVDWGKVEEALAIGPPGTPPLVQEQWDYLRVEQALRAWCKSKELMPCDTVTLQSAAQVLTNLRTRDPRDTTKRETL